jgi:DTW domain-containing protein YfiP
VPKLELNTRLCLVIHAKEMKRTTNTGRLALKCLPNSEMKVRGDLNNPLDLSDILVPEYRTVLFYPAEDAEELTINFVQADPRPIQLIVPDGNWRQASKVHHRHAELKDIPRVKISTPNEETLHMRVETIPEGMATLEAIAHAMGIIEGDTVKEKLLQFYQAKLKETLKGRGIKI